MATKDKNVPKENKLIYILTKDYKYQDLILGFVATLAGGLSIMILTDILTVSNRVPIIGDYPDVFAWTLLIISLFGLILTIYPFFLPAFPELRKITWANGKTMIDNSARVFFFMILVALILLVYQMIIVGILEKITG